MVTTPRIGSEFVGWEPPCGSDEGLGLVDFSIFPHLNVFPQNSLTYAVDERTAIKVTDRAVEVISEGYRRHFGPTFQERLCEN